MEDLFKFAKGNLSGKLHLFCSVWYSFDLTSPTGPIPHKSSPCELQPAIEEANFRKDFWFLMKVLYI